MPHPPALPPPHASTTHHPASQPRLGISAALSTRFGRGLQAGARPWGARRRGRRRHPPGWRRGPAPAHVCVRVSVGSCPLTATFASHPQTATVRAISPRPRLARELHWSLERLRHHLAQLAVVTTQGFRHEVLVIGQLRTTSQVNTPPSSPFLRFELCCAAHLLGSFPRGAVDPLEHGILLIATPVSSRDLQPCHQCLVQENVPKKGLLHAAHGKIERLRSVGKDMHIRESTVQSHLSEFKSRSWNLT